MYTYLRLDELSQDGRELQWTAVAFEEREIPPNMRALYDAWRGQVRRAADGRAEPGSGWESVPASGRDLARHAGEILDILTRLRGQS